MTFDRALEAAQDLRDRYEEIGKYAVGAGKDQNMRRDAQGKAINRTEASLIQDLEFHIKHGNLSEEARARLHELTRKVRMTDERTKPEESRHRRKSP